MEQVEKHTHDGVDSPKIEEKNIINAVDKNNVMLLTGNQTASGVKTFTSIPVLPSSDPTTDDQAARKAYVDATVGNLQTIASSNLRDSANTDRSTASDSYIKVKEIKYNEVGGVVRVKIIANVSKADPTGYVRIYKNGVAYGTERAVTASSPTTDTFTEDLTFATDDLIQLYYKHTASDPTATVKVLNFELYYDKILTVTPGTVQTD